MIRIGLLRARRALKKVVVGEQWGSSGRAVGEQLGIRESIVRVVVELWDHELSLLVVS